MPWKQPKSENAQEAFVQRRLREGESFKASCLACRISRKTGYKWWGRFCHEGLDGLRPRRRGRRGWQAEVWKKRVQGLRRRHRHWGAHLLRMLLRRAQPGAPVPAARTIERWLKLHRRRRRRWRGPHLPPLVRTAPVAPNAVWTVDFKGSFRTGDRTRMEPLTVRDAYSHCVLLALDLPRKDYPSVRRALTRVFHRHGLPQAIWTDNGPPFGGEGALGLTRLSVWWLRLGIRVEYGRPGRPGDNAAHENMHGVFQREITRSPAVHPAAQAQRIRRWLKTYNTVRPQGVLQGAAAAMIYRNSTRRLPRHLPDWPARRNTPVRRVSSGGWISYGGKKRLIGRPFAGQPVCLQEINPLGWEIYLGPHLLGQLRFTESHLRPARRRTPVQSREGAKAPSLATLPILSDKTNP